MSKLAALLGGMTLNDLAKEILASQGRRGDTELAHVNKKEAAILQDMGGSGSTNPDTGMTEYFDGMDYPMDMGIEYGQDALGGDFGQVTQGPQDYSYMAPESVAFESGTTGFGDVGQPTPSMAGGQISPAAPEISAFPGAQQFTPDYSRFAGAYPEIGSVAQEPAAAPQGPGILGKAEEFAKKYPTATRTLGAAAMGLPGALAGRRMGREAARTRQEMEQMAAPIRAQGEQLLGAGQRGELTAPQQQQIQAARAAARQSLSQRGVTSGTAAQQAENRITELAQRFAQQNIDQGVRLIGAANSFNAAAIRDAYKMNADAANMTQNYFTNLMRAFGAIPSQTTPTQPQQTGMA